MRSVEVNGWTGSRCLVYALTDPRTGAHRYVGYSTYGVVRPKRHRHGGSLARDTNLHKVRWIREMASVGVTYSITVLEECANQAEAIEAERRWIAHGRAHGWPLTNLTEGGEGLRGASESTRRKIGEHARRRMADPEFRERVIGARRGKPLPEEWRRNLSIAGRGKKRSPEVGRKISARQTGRKRGPVRQEVREAIRQKMLQREITPEHRANISAGLRGRRKSPEAVAKMAEAQRRIWNTPHGREIQGQRNRKLTPEQVDDIRTRIASGQRVMAIAKAFGVCRATIDNIRSGRRYASVGVAAQGRPV